MTIGYTKKEDGKEKGQRIEEIKVRKGYNLRFVMLSF
jgi:hypothetical protein